MTLFRLTRRAFVAPNILEEGTVIDYNGPLGTAFAAVDEEGQALLDAFYKEHPNVAALADHLRELEGQPKLEEAKAVVVETPPPPVPDEIVGSIALPGKPKVASRDTLAPAKSKATVTPPEEGRLTLEDLNQPEATAKVVTPPPPKPKN